MPQYAKNEPILLCSHGDGGGGSGSWGGICLECVFVFRGKGEGGVRKNREEGGGEREGKRGRRRDGREQKERERTKSQEEGINLISLQIAGTCIPACNTVTT